ncbi:MAG: RIO1 family regulatory kinase/ATPase [Candidatus Thorarchaeota archaeon]
MPIEKFNPNKGSAILRKRKQQRGGRRGKDVAIPEITLDTVKRHAISFGLATDVSYQIAAGKEASIFLAGWKGYPIILKAYRLWNSAQASKKRGAYAQGKMEALAVKEFDLLWNCFQAGIRVPTPISRVGNYLTMRFIGDGISPAPQLNDVVIDKPNEVLDEILEQYLIMYREINYVHGDLSRFNILWWDDRPWIIDVPQAYKVDTYCSMHKTEALLRRDIANLLEHFEQYGVYRDEDQILNTFLDAYIPHNMQHYRELTPEGRELL